MCWLSVKNPIAPQQMANTGESRLSTRWVETYVRSDSPPATSASAALGFMVIAPPPTPLPSLPRRSSLKSAESGGGRSHLSGKQGLHRLVAVVVLVAQCGLP